MADCCRFLLALCRSLCPAVAGGVVEPMGGGLELGSGGGEAAAVVNSTVSLVQEEAAKRKAAAKARQV